MSEPEDASDEARRDEAGSPRRFPSWLRVALALGLLVVLAVIGRATGLDELLDRDRVRALVEGAGALGVLAYLGVFTVGQLLGVPGLVFVAAGIVVYGPLHGALLGLVGAVFAMTVSFQIVRTVGGQPLGAAQRPFMKRVLAQLDARPVRAVALLRLVFWLAPPVNYALALSRIRLRDFVLGSLIGLVLPITCAAVFFDWIFG